MQSSSVSLLTPIGYQSSDCGYCKTDDHSSKRAPKSRALSTPSRLYQFLLKQLSIPFLPAASIAPSRDQRQSLYRWNKFVLGDSYIKDIAKQFPRSKEEKARQKSGFDLHHTVHEAETQNLKPSSPAHRFEVTLEPDTFTEEKFLLYKNYQIKVHHDKPEEVSKAGFKRFLCSSPLHRSVRNRDGEDQKLGSYHHCYRLDGKLIALAVLDLLPHAVSGVYFLYHQEVEQWSFGKMSAMREAALAFEGGYEFYYMGYYIHNCVKMRYKGDYKPQYVLDPETYDWNLLDDDLIQLLNQKKYVSVSRERERARHDLPVKADHPKKDNEQSTESVASEPEFPLPVPNDAVMSGQSLLTLGMPGIPSSEGLTRQTNLDQIQIFIGSGKTMIVKTSDLQTWEDGNIEDSSSLKGIVAEFVACVGPDVAKQVILDFSR